MDGEMDAPGGKEAQVPEERLAAVRKALEDTDRIADGITEDMREIVDGMLPLSDERFALEDTIAEFRTYVKKAEDDIWEQTLQGRDIRPTMTTLLAGIQTFAQRFGQWLGPRAQSEAGREGG